MNCGFRSLKGKASIFNPNYPINKRFSLGYKVQQTFFASGKINMNLVNNVNKACCLRVIIVIETYFYLVEMRNLTRNSNVRELNWKKLKLVDKIITHCFIE